MASDRFAEHLKQASATVRTWPLWKQSVLGGIPTVGEDMKDELPQEMILKYGEKYSKMIYSSLAFLDSNQPTWGLDEPIDRREYVENLIKEAMVL